MLIPSRPCLGDGHLNAGRALPGWTATTTTRAAVPTLVLLLSAYGQPVESDCGRGYATAEFQVAAYLGNIAEHVFEIASHRDLFYWVGQFAVDDPHAGGSAGVITGY